MNSALDTRRTIEALRSGVPSDAAVRSLGTTQQAIKERFLASLNGVQGEPLVVEANFGDGKSHLLHSLRVLAEAEGFVTSTVVVGPDAPIGNAQVILKSIVEGARAPGRTGKALAELSATSNRTAIADLRIWARDSEISDRFRALLRIYEATQDDELRADILNDF